MTDTSSAGWGLRGTAGVSFAATLEFDEVEVKLGGRVVLDHFSLTLKPGEIVCLLGESGSGKSTALRVAAGIQPVHSGTVRINGEIVSSPTRTVPPDRRGIGLMFQDFALFPHLTVLQNVLFGLRRLGRDAALGQALDGPGVQVALDQIIVRGDAAIGANGEVAFLSPMSGG